MEPSQLQEFEPWQFAPEAVAERIRTGLADMFAPLGVDGSEFAVGFKEPKATCEQSFSLRTSAVGEASIQWSDRDPVSLRVPWCHAGVFLLRSDRTWQVERWRWQPRLTWPPGVHFLSHRGRTRALVVADRSHTTEGEPGKPRSWKPFRPPSYVPVYSPVALRKELEEKLELSGRLRHAITNWRDLRAAVRESCTKAVVSENEICDARDVTRQRLYTYNVHVQETVLRHFAWAIWQVDKARQALAERDQEAAPKDLPRLKDLWDEVAEHVRGRDPVSAQRMMANGLLVRFAPLNGIDAISGLTEFLRHDASSATLERMPAGKRQNHVSFEGLICPVESPETQKVGITLHTANGCRVTIDGRLRPPQETSGVSRLGHAAAMVPFAQHNDGARCMMGAKNLKQAVVVKKAKEPAVATGAEEHVRDILAPLQKAGLLDDAETTTAAGIDLLVAYLPWYGWNADDAIAANARLRDVLAWKYVEEHERYTRPGVRPCNPPTGAPGQDAALAFIGGLRKTGDRVGPRDAVAWLTADTTGPVEVLSSADTEATLAGPDFQEPYREGFGGRLSWQLHYRLPLGVGDKLMGRHGNKGVVSTLLPADRLPRLPDVPALPEKLRGRAVDLVLNPNGVVSRMNLGQLIETHVGLLARLRPDLDVSTGLGTPFAFDESRQLDLRNRFAEVEQKTGGVVDRYGRVRLELPPAGGAPVRQVRVVAGFQYFVRLKHIPALKANARRGGVGYSYARATGQPVRGRRRRGGQRLGEMEMWALDAHQATENLREVLGVRAAPPPRDPSPPAAPAEGSAAAGPGGSATFSAIRDHLRAVGVALRPENGERPLRWLNDEELTSGSEVTSDETWRRATEGDLGCRHCDYRLDGVIGTRRTQRDEPQACVGDVLRGHFSRDGVPPEVSLSEMSEATPNRAAVPEPGQRFVKLRVKTRNRRATTVAVSLKQKATSLTIAFMWDATNAKWKYAAYGRIEKERTGNGSTTQARGNEASATIDVRLLLGLRLTCPRCRGFEFLRFQRRQPSLHAAPGGVCDPALVGPAGRTAAAAPTIGFIRLPAPVPNPLCRALPKKEDASRSSLPDVKSVWVLPLRYRDPGSLSGPGSGKPPLSDPLTDNYSQLVIACTEYRDLDKKRAELGKKKTAERSEIDKKMAARYADMTSRVEAIYRHIVGDPRGARSARAAGRLFGKLGLLRRDGLGRRVDGSGRLVIVPDPSLAPDECALPDLLVRELDMQNSMQSPSAGNLRVLLNRCPTLHRYNLLAFRAREHSEDTGASPVLRLNPMACKPFSADFDGDEMAVHLPRDEPARRELEDLSFGSPSNRLSLADSSPLIGFGQELALGHYLFIATKGWREAAEAFAEEVLATNCPTCVVMRAEKSVEKVLTHLLQEHGPDALSRITRWAELAWTVATHAGISFGWLEIADTASTELPARDARTNDELEKCTERAIERAVSQDSNAACFGLAVLYASGARGNLKQLRQILGPRGRLSPGDGNDGNDARFWIQSSLSTGMHWSDFFHASFNARSSMVDKKLLVGRAGGLTRSLVLACWPWRIGPVDCGAPEPRSPVTCEAAESSRSVCSACYGPVEAQAGLLPKGFPVGLVAAQSVGERGTQLSMQSFHTGTRVMTPDTVRELLNDRGETRSESFYRSSDGFERFVRWLGENVPAYKPLDKRHLAMIWLAIHHSPERSLRSAWTTRAGALGRLAGGSQLRDLVVDLVAAPEQVDAATDEPDTQPHPVARLLAGAAPHVDGA